MLENSEKLGGFEILCLKNWGKIIWGLVLQMAWRGIDNYVIP